MLLSVGTAALSGERGVALSQGGRLGGGDSGRKPAVGQGWDLWGRGVQEGRGVRGSQYSPLLYLPASGTAGREEAATGETRGL